MPRSRRPPLDASPTATSLNDEDTCQTRQRSVVARRPNDQKARPVTDDGDESTQYRSCARGPRRRSQTSGSERGFVLQARRGVVDNVPPGNGEGTWQTLMPQHRHDETNETPMDGRGGTNAVRLWGWISRGLAPWNVRRNDNRVGTDEHDIPADGCSAGAGWLGGGAQLPWCVAADGAGAALTRVVSGRVGGGDGGVGVREEWSSCFHSDDGGGGEHAYVHAVAVRTGEVCARDETCGGGDGHVPSLFASLSLRCNAAVATRGGSGADETCVSCVGAAADLFNRMDTHGAGHVTYEQLAKHGAATGLPAGLVAEFMSEADTAYRGKINMCEFLAYVRSKDEVLRSTFRALDTEHVGRVSLVGAAETATAASMHAEQTLHGETTPVINP